MSKNIEDLGIEESAGFKNLQAVAQYTKDTRKLFRELEKEVENYKNQSLQDKQTISNLQSQVAILQAKVLAGGATTI